MSLSWCKHAASAHGQREPIWLDHDGKIIDGRNRYRACVELGIEPIERVYEGEHLLAFVVSLNLHRRHLDESQRSMVAAKIATMRQGERTDITAIAVMSQAEAAGLLNVSVDSVQRAKVIHEQGAPELSAAVMSGEVSVSAAAEVATLPQEEQQEIVARGEKEIVAAAKEIRARRQRARREKRVKLIVETKVSENELMRYETVIERGLKTFVEFV